MPAETRRERERLLLRRRLEVDPGQAVVLKLSDARPLRRRPADRELPRDGAGCEAGSASVLRGSAVGSAGMFAMVAAIPPKRDEYPAGDSEFPSMHWAEEVGLVLDIVGALILASGLIIGRERALELGVPRYASDNEEENLRLPQVRDRLIQSASSFSCSVSWASSSATGRAKAQRGSDPGTCRNAVVATTDMCGRGTLRLAGRTRRGQTGETWFPPLSE